MEKFPHIQNKTAYPYLDNVDPYAYQITSGPTAWGVNSTVRLLRVPWDGDYSNVIDFGTNEARDEWIDEKTSEKYTLETETIKQPDGTFRVPIPANDCMQYNYLVVDFPAQPVDYGDEGIKRICYFITNAKWLAASTTELSLEIDYWTTYINSTHVSYMMLDRGHAPMAAAPAPADFLANPIDNTQYISTPDISPSGNRDISATMRRDISKQISSYVFQNAGKMLGILAVTADLISENFGTYKTADMRIPASEQHLETGYANYDYIAIEADKLFEFLETCTEKMPYLLETVVACLYVPADYVQLGRAIDIVGYTVHRIQPKNQTIDLVQITPEIFDYPEQYAKLTKLYTSQYAEIEITDENGSASRVKIEDIGSNGQIKLWAALNLVGPSAGYDAHILNVGGSKTSTDTWSYVKGFGNLSFTTGGAWYDNIMHWDIPQFAIFTDQEYYQGWRRWWTIQQQIEAKENAYTQAIDAATTSKANADRSALSSHDSTARSALTTYDNTIASTNQAYTNAERSANASNAQALASNATAQQNALASNATSNTNTLASNATAYQISVDTTTAANDDASSDRNLSNKQQDFANEITRQTADYTAKKSRVDMSIANVLTHASAETDKTLGLSNMAAQTIGGGMGGALVGGSAGAVGGAAMAGVNAITSIAAGQLTADNQTKFNNAGFFLNYGNTQLGSTTADNIVDEYNRWSGSISGDSLTGVWIDFNTSMAGQQTTAGNRNQLAKTQNASNLTLGGSGRMYDLNGNIVDSTANYAGTAVQNKTTSDANANRAKTTADSNANRTKTTADSNANLAKTTAITNAAESKQIALNNNDATKATVDANNERTYATATTNNAESYNLSVRNADRSRALAEYNINAGTQDAELAAPKIYGQFSNVDHVLTKPNAVYVNIRKMNDGNVHYVGDQMLRYGYTLGQAWEMKEKQLMAHYTYWQAEDVWIECCRPAIEPAADMITRIFKQGVTVWSNPDDIGKINIYQNWKES